jgi:hypothetical protein
MNTLSTKLVEDLLVDAIKDGIHQRYAEETSPFMVSVSLDGNVKIFWTANDSDGKSHWQSLVVSIRGCKYIYAWLDRLSAEIMRQNLAYKRPFSAPYMKSLSA